jgi:hypothetical protein
MRQEMTENAVQARNFLTDCKFVFGEWDARVKALDSEGLLQLYATDALLESPLVPAVSTTRATAYCVAIEN